MPLTIKQGTMRIKNDNEYIGIDTVAETTTQQQVAAIQAAGTTNVGNVNTAGSTQVAAIEAKGVETRASIPDDYTELSDSVADLRGAISLTVTEKFNFSGQIVDTRGKTTTELGYIGNDVWFNFSDGVYYTNPFTNNTGKIIYLWPRDSSDEAITLTKGSSTYQNIELSNSYLWKITVDGLTVNAKGYANLTNYQSDSPTFNQTYTVSSKPHHWRFKGNGYTPNGTIDRGITIDEYSTEYVEFVEPTSEYIYAKELDDHIQEFTAESEAKMEEEIAEVDGKIGDLPPLVAKTAEVRMVYSGNVVDTTGKTAPASQLDRTIHFVFPNGTYYSNPWVTNTGKSITLYPRDVDGNAVYMTSRKDQQTRATYIDAAGTYLMKIVIDDLDVSAYLYQTQVAFDVDDYTLSYLYTLDSAPAYWEFGGSGYTQGGNIERGFTQSTYSGTYVAYAEPTKSYAYSEELDEHISDYSDAVKNTIFKPSMNLLDYSKIIWIANSGYYYLKREYYMPVTAGDTIVTNNEQGQFQFFDEDYASVSNAGFSTKYSPIAVPSGAVWARVIFSTSFIVEGDPVMVWVAQSATSAKYERPIYRPSIQYAPQYADGSMFDYAVPQNLTQGVVKMARFAALRAANERQSAYRFATYNTYVSRGDSGFWLLREMAFDYALDFMGMQECGFPGTTVQAAMYPFQFPYGTGVITSGGNNVPVPAVSRFVITNVEDIDLEESRHCLKISMNLPQDKHYPRVPTLSVYNYHGSLSKANRLAEIQTMLAVIAEDTADFKIVMGDTNSEVDQQGHRQSWDAWENAGFTAVHHGESPTWPSQVNPSNYSSMDNIFVSEHINVLGYNIVPWQNYLLPGDLPLSDHDMVYADLQFDFDAVLKDTWEEPQTVT